MSQQFILQELKDITEKEGDSRSASNMNSIINNSKNQLESESRRKRSNSFNFRVNPVDNQNDPESPNVSISQEPKKSAFGKLKLSNDHGQRLSLYAKKPRRSLMKSPRRSTGISRIKAMKNMNRRGRRQSLAIRVGETNNIASRMKSMHFQSQLKENQKSSMGIKKTSNLIKKGEKEEYDSGSDSDSDSQQ